MSVLEIIVGQLAHKSAKSVLRSSVRIIDHSPVSEFWEIT